MQLPFTFLYPWLLLLVLGAVPFLWLRRKRQNAMGHSRVGMHANVRSVPIVGRLPAIFFSIAFVALVAALAHPQLPELNETRSMETRDICIAVDISGSMSGALPTQSPNGGQSTAPAPGATTQQQTYRRLDAARDAAVAFVKARQGDRICVMVFDDNSYFYWPLSDDMRIVERKAGLVNSYTGGGTNFEGPSDRASGIGPFQATINHMRDYGKARTKVLVLVTDGEDSISQKRQEELAAQMQEQGIKLYVLGVGEGWVNGNTTDLAKFTDRLGGKVYRVGDAGAMQQAFADINALETSRITVEKSTSYRDISEYFSIAAAVFFALFLGFIVFTREDA